jgi:hypothetical protein
MAMPSSATPASMLLLERSLKDIMIKTCEAEQRSKLLGTLLRMNLLTNDVRNFLVKQVDQQRSLGLKRGGGKKKLVFKLKSGKQRMNEKLKDSRKDEV